MDKFKFNAEENIKRLEQLKAQYESVFSLTETNLLLSFKNNISYIEDKGSLVSYLVDPNPDVRQIAKEELERREHVRANEEKRKRTWYRSLLTRIRGILPTRSEDSGHIEEHAKTKRRAARERY